MLLSLLIILNRHKRAPRAAAAQGRGKLWEAARRGKAPGESWEREEGGEARSGKATEKKARALTAACRVSGLQKDCC